MRFHTDLDRRLQARDVKKYAEGAAPQGPSPGAAHSSTATIAAVAWAPTSSATTSTSHPLSSSTTPVANTTDTTTDTASPTANSAPHFPAWYMVWEEEDK